MKYCTSTRVIKVNTREIQISIRQSIAMDLNEIIGRRVGKLDRKKVDGFRL